MVADNIKDYFIMWSLIGIFSLGLISFAVLFPIYQGESDIFDNNTRLNDTIESLKSTIQTSPTYTNANINLSKEYDPTTSDSGADFTQIGSGFNILTFTTGIWGVLKVFFFYAFGELSIIIILIAGSIFSLIGIFFLIKNLRTGN